MGTGYDGAIDVTRSAVAHATVDDVEQTPARAVTAGGTVLVPPTIIEGIGEWGMFADPDGIPIGLFHEK